VRRYSSIDGAVTRSTLKDSFCLFRFILETVEARIIEQDSEGPPATLASEIQRRNRVMDESCRVFCNLLTTTCTEGMDMTSFLPSCVKLVSRWCQVHLGSNSSVTTLAVAAKHMSRGTALLSGITNLLRSNPEQSVAPLTRHGKSMLLLAKVLYPTALSSPQRRALIDYFRCHL
jgi:hypothetical protein